MKSFKIVLFNILSVILVYYIAILLHEYGHATTAWFLSYKSSPFDIDYRNWFLLPVSEGVNYPSILASGHGVAEALIGISGISVTVILFLLSFYFINRQFILKNTFLLCFFFWLMDINLMEMFSYVPNRSFIMGDIGEFVQGLNISPLWFVIPGTLLVCLALYRFYRYELLKMFALLPIKTIVMQRIFLWCTFWPLLFSIVYWEPPIANKALSYGANLFSLLLVLLIIFICDPKRCWIRNKMSS